jgi:hypothetical protein
MVFRCVAEASAKNSMPKGFHEIILSYFKGGHAATFTK